MLGGLFSLEAPLTEFEAQLRHRCRNLRCRSKLTEPVENAHRAFCTHGCYQQHYRRRCAVCERELPPGPANRRLCKRRECRLKLRAFPHLYGWRTGHDSQTVKGPLKSPIKSDTFWRDKQGRAWCWERILGGGGETRDDDDWRLADREGREVARIRQEGGRYWVGYPRCIPEQPLESLKDAKRRAVNMALWALPTALPKQPKPTRPCANIQLETFRHSDWQPTNGGGECPDIPAFLRRPVQPQTEHPPRYCSPGCAQKARRVSDSQNGILSANTMKKAA